MSDGPDKTLGMTQRWRAFARSAASEAYEATEVCQYLAQALSADFRREVTPSFVAALRRVLSDDPQSSLFTGKVLDRLEALRGRAAGSPLADGIINCAIETVTEEMDGPDALREAVRRARLERAQRGTWQVETNHRQKAPEVDSVNVRCRSQAAVVATPFDSLAAHPLGEETKPLERQVQRQTGIEDGPPL